VGTLLVVINHWDTLFFRQLTLREEIKITPTYFVPNGVSTYVSVVSIKKVEEETNQFHLK
jgi:hypothetical protein